MTTISFTAPGLPPSKKNKRTLSFRGGRAGSFSGKTHRRWLPSFKRLALQVAREACPGRPHHEPVISGPFIIDVMVHPKKPKAKLKRLVLPTPKRADVDGIMTSVLDALQGDRVKVGRKIRRVGGVIGDDYWCVDERTRLGEFRARGEIVVTITIEPDMEYLERLGVAAEVMRPARGRKS